MINKLVTRNGADLVISRSALIIRKDKCMSLFRVLNRFSEKDREKVEKNPDIKEMIIDGERLFDRTNKRIRNLEKNNKYISPALNALKKKRGDAPRFGTLGTYGNLNEYLKEVARAQQFSNLETSSVQGARSFTKNLKKQLNKKIKEGLSDDFIANVFDTLHGVHERMPDLLYRVQLKYSDYMDVVIDTIEENENNDNLEDNIISAINKLTEKIADNENTIDEVYRMSKGTGRLY